MPYDPMRTKFRQSKDYTHEMLVRDLIQYSEEVSDIFGGFDARLLPVEGAVSSLEGRMTSVEGRVTTAEADIVSLKSRATSLEGRMNSAEIDINNLEAQDISLDSRLDVIELAMPALTGRVTALEGKFESGTWLPRISFNGNSVGQTYTNRWGQWQRIDKYYTYSFMILTTARGTSTGNAYIDGFPRFGLTGFGTLYHIVGNFGYTNGLVVDSGYHGWTLLGWTETANLGVRINEVASGSVGLATHANVSNATYLMGRFDFILP